MRWVANLSNGDVAVEAEVPGFESAWRRMMGRCIRDGLWLTRLGLEVAGRTHWCPAGERGYWHACLGLAVLGAAASPSLEAKGVGWVEGSSLHTIWAASDGRLWRGPPRTVAGEGQVIWAPQFRARHGGANERVFVLGGERLREADGARLTLPRPALPRVSGRREQPAVIELK